MTLNSNRKRKLVLEDFNSSLKKFKAINTSDVDIDEDLHIDLEFDVNCEKLIEQIATRPLDYDSASVTLSSGRRFYVKTHSDDAEFIIRQTPSTTTASASYYRLLDEIELSMAAKKSVVSVAADSDILMCATDRLWVDKYAPRKYCDLLSNEFVNRNLLTWLKLWDKFVFKKEARLTFLTEEALADDSFRVSDHDGRPLRKAVLLSGPPGIGKTTLAQILARHCGYRPMEINASNERNAEQFTERIDTANSMSGWVNNSNVMQPSCLIIDEIDGTSTAAINVLISAINNVSGNSAETHRSKKGKEKNKLSIRRPVICICNDPYAPSLKNLRPLCYVIRVGTPDYSQMLFRLSDICDRESMACDRDVLSRLIDSSNRDIRSSLNTLQFLKQKGSKEVTTKDLESLNVGNKDVQKGIFSVWEEIFTSTTLKNSYGQSEGKGLRESSQRSSSILRLTHSTGDLDRVISGIHENYLSLVKFNDVRLTKMIESTQWMVFNDLSNQKIASQQLYELMRYKQYIIPYFHLSFASSNIANKKISWPTSDVNAHFNQQKMQSIYQSFMGNQTIINSWFHAKHEVIKDVLPSLSRIIRPLQLRPINTHLFSSKEKSTLNNTIINMIATGLNYIQEKSGDLTFQYVLQPNIAALVEFNLAESDHKQLSYAAKQLIANEVKAEKIRKYAAPVGSVNVRKINNNINNSQNRMSVILQQEKAMTTNATILDPKKKTTHFTFQITKKSNEADCESNVITNLLNQTMRYRFKEGCTNAIKRVVRIKDM